MAARENQQQLVLHRRQIDVLSVVVDAKRADEIFEFLYERGGIGDRGGFMYQAALPKASVFKLPEGLPVEH